MSNLNLWNLFGIRGHNVIKGVILKRASHFPKKKKKEKERKNISGLIYFSLVSVAFSFTPLPAFTAIKMLSLSLLFRFICSPFWFQILLIKQHGTVEVCKRHWRKEAFGKLGCYMKQNKTK